MADVAQAAGVSVATVSKVVNNKDGISPARTAHVRRIIDEMGYAASLGAQSLRSRSTGVLGMLVAEFEPFSTELLKGASRAIKATEYELLAYSGRSHSAPEDGWERRHLARLSGALIDGAVIVTPSGTETIFPVPVVAIDPHLDTDALPTVRCNSYDGAFQATSYLADLGHTKIGYLGGRSDLKSSQERELGYRDALLNAGIAANDDYIGQGDYLPEASQAPAREILSRKDRPTAIFAANDLSAIEVIKVAEELGLNVPRDLSVIGFDNVPEAALFRIPLTTMAQPLGEMGEIALNMLAKIISGEDVETQALLPVELVVRDSCAPPLASEN